MQTAFARLTVVVPVGPGDHLPQPLRAQLSALPAEAQVIVVCADEVQAVVTRVGLHSHTGPRWQCIAAAAGRASQQNAGAAVAGNRWLWFVHADAQLAPATLPALARLLATDAPALGYFDLRFLDDGPAMMALNTLGAWLRSRCLGLPFGDQGLVLPRDTFIQLGGFDAALTCGEDHDLVWRARRAGLPLRALGAPLYTSARKYAQRGWGATTLGHLRETWRQARRFSSSQARP